jgi:hypothetical protein
MRTLPPGNKIYHEVKKINTKNLKQIFPEKELRDQSLNFHSHAAYSAAGNMWTDFENI